MQNWLVWVLAAGALTLIALGYWQIVVADGAYLGQRAVTWLYDLTAPRYDDIKQYDPEMEAVFLGRPLAEALATVPAPLVLDVATGTGRLPLALFEQPTFRGKVIGVDASRPMLRLGAQKLRAFDDRLLLLWRDAAALPFPDGVFDAVTVLEVAEFTPDPPALLAEALRVLRPGGVFVTTRRRGTNATLMPGKTHDRPAFEALLAERGCSYVEIMPWQVEYDLVWALKEGASAGGGRQPLSVLACPHCNRIGPLRQDESALRCAACGKAFPQRDGLYDFR